MKEQNGLYCKYNTLYSEAGQRHFECLIDTRANFFPKYESTISSRLSPNTGTSFNSSFAVSHLGFMSTAEYGYTCSSSFIYPGSSNMMPLSSVFSPRFILMTPAMCL
uniref:Uncharacterized protein n=1 Tax=Cacopsylla melanoneura TaxID=428564 RepID=A0A8D8LX54_9HEMI